MIFPEDPEIREFTSYAIRARKIIIEEFSKLEGRPPNELEIQELLKMVVVPFGILKQQNGNSHFQSAQIATQKQKNESALNSVMDIMKEHSELSIEGERVVMKKRIEPVDVFYAVRNEMERRGVEICKGKTYRWVKLGNGVFRVKGRGEGMTKNSKEKKEFEFPECTISVTVAGGGLPPFKRELDSSRIIMRASLG